MDSFSRLLPKQHETTSSQRKGTPAAAEKNEGLANPIHALLSKPTRNQPSCHILSAKGWILPIWAVTLGLGFLALCWRRPCACEMQAGFMMSSVQNLAQPNMFQICMLPLAQSVRCRENTFAKVWNMLFSALSFGWLGG